MYLLLLSFFSSIGKSIYMVRLRSVLLVLKWLIAVSYFISA